LFASNFFAYSSGTGAEAGMLRAPATIAPRGRSSLKAIVVSSGVSMPVISYRLAVLECLEAVQVARVGADVRARSG
jgi:hypothetical protein